MDSKLLAAAAVFATLALPVAAHAHDKPGLSGSITGSASANDNIFAGPNNEVNDTVWGVSGRINWNAETDQGSLGL